MAKRRPAHQPGVHQASALVRAYRVFVLVRFGIMMHLGRLLAFLFGTFFALTRKALGVFWVWLEVRLPRATVASLRKAHMWWQHEASAARHFKNFGMAVAARRAGLGMFGVLMFLSGMIFTYSFDFSQEAHSSYAPALPTAVQSPTAKLVEHATPLVAPIAVETGPDEDELQNEERADAPTPVEKPAELSASEASKTEEKTDAKAEETSQELVPATVIAAKDENGSVFTGFITEEEPKDSSTHATVEHVVQKGDTFASLFGDAGMDREAAHNAIAALREEYDLNKLQVGEQMTFQFEKSDGIVGATFSSLSISKPGEDIILRRNEEGEFEAEKVARKLITRTVRASGVVKSSIYQLGVKSLNVPAEVVLDAIRILSYDVDFQRDVQQNDRFEVVYEEVVNDKGERVKGGDVIYAALKNESTDVAIYRYLASDGTKDYYDRNGRTVRKALLKTPISGAMLSSGFGMRKHPILGYSKLHAGVDFAAPKGTPIFASGDGVVDFQGVRNGYGNYMRIKHNGTYSTAYAHISRFARNMKTGARVKQGQVIAYVGATGRATGPHLHYEVLISGKQVNPLKVKMMPGKALSATGLASFKKQVKQVDELIANAAVPGALAENKTKQD